MKDVIKRTVAYLRYEVDVEEIHRMLLAEGLTEHQAWLTYKAAQLLVKASKERDQADACVPTAMADLLLEEPLG